MMLFKMNLMNEVASTLCFIDINKNYLLLPERSRPRAGSVRQWRIVSVIHMSSSRNPYEVES
jgi:hypothetical protein